MTPDCLEAPQRPISPQQNSLEDPAMTPTAPSRPAVAARRARRHRGPILAPRLAAAQTAHRRPTRDSAPGEHDTQPAARLVARAPERSTPVQMCSSSIRRSATWCPATPRSTGCATGAQWAEGPAWSSQGRYVVFSDVRATPSTATSGTTAGSPLSQAVEQHQRQHLRFSGSQLPRGLTAASCAGA